MYETIWFILWGLLWAVYFATDGYDLGMGALMPFLAKDDRDKRVIYNAAGPFWDGNEVWLITAGGATFAAFPAAYAALFSGLYTALLLLLLALVVRGVTFEFRSKMENPRWRALWDGAHAVSSFLPALLLGVAFANIFRGLPLDAEGVNQDGILQLLNPYGLAGGVLFTLLFCVHGSIWLAIKSEGPIHERAVAMAERLWLPLTLVYALFVGMTAVSTNLLANYMDAPLLLLIPVVAVGALVLIRPALGRRAMWTAFGFSALTIVGTTFFGVAGLFPALLPSTLNPAFSLTIHNAASSQLTLKIMLGVAGIFVPIVLLYQGWTHVKFSHKITDEDLAEEEAY